jgi:hypothetical protein
MKRIVAYLGVAVAVVLVIAAVQLSLWTNRVKPPMVGVVVARSAVDLQARPQPYSGEFVVDRVLAPADSWVVVSGGIRSRVPGGSTGASAAPEVVEWAIIGIAHVRAGETRDVVVPLEPFARRGPQVRVSLYADRGTPGRFDFDMRRFQESLDKPYFVADPSVGGAPRQYVLTVSLN